MKAFIELVKAMRMAQKDYFKTRNSASLLKSKALERQVDHDILNMMNPKLFDKP